MEGGELIVGTMESPQLIPAEIVLHGAGTDETLIINNENVAGNKAIGNIGTISMYGVPRSRMTRLVSTAEKGD